MSKSKRAKTAWHKKNRKEAGASFPLRKTALVDLTVLDAYMDAEKCEDEKTSKKVLSEGR